MAHRPIIALTPGEPAGVGPDIVLALAARPPACGLVLIADPVMLAARATKLGLPFAPETWRGRAHDDDRHGWRKCGARSRPYGDKRRSSFSATAAVYILPLATAHPVTAGHLDPANSAYVIECLRRAVRGCLSGEFDALVTGPVNKGAINDAGIPFTGHTEFLAAQAGAAQVVMLLTAPGLRVALATTHLPLSAVSRAITREHLTGVLEILHTDLRARFGIADPVILVCGLNPHAGEAGHLGREEIEVIEPVLAALRARGMQLRGPAPADTAFLPAALAGVDAVLAMYHDQGLPVLKRHDFAHAVNITLGLPFVRTSVDHGTALDLAGSGRADPTSLETAIALAVELAQKKTA